MPNIVSVQDISGFYFEVRNKSMETTWAAEGAELRALKVQGAGAVVPEFALTAAAAATTVQPGGNRDEQSNECEWNADADEIFKR